MRKMMHALFITAVPLLTPLHASDTVTANRLQLTPLTGTHKNTCVWALDQRRSVVVFANDLRGNGSRLGVNGRTYSFTFNEFTYDSVTGANIFRSRDRKLFVRATPTRRITTGNDDIDVLSISVAMDGIKSTVTGYRFCPSGD